MKTDFLKKILLIFLIFGILCGLIFGFVIGLMILSLFYNFAAAIFFSILIFPFFLWSFWKRIRRKDWFVIIRNFITIFLISTFLTAMFSVEEGAIPFSKNDLIVILLSIILTFVAFVLFGILIEFYSSSRIYKRIENFYKGLKIIGLLPDFEEKK